MRHRNKLDLSFLSHCFQPEKLLAALFLIPFLMFFFQPMMGVRLQFDPPKEAGQIQVYRTDSSVSFNYRSVFDVSKTTTTLQADGLHEDLTVFRLRFTGIRELNLKQIQFRFFGVPVKTMRAEEIASSIFDATSIRTELKGKSPQEILLHIPSDNADLYFKPYNYLSFPFWAGYLLVLYGISLLLVQGLFALLEKIGVKNRLEEILFFSYPAAVVVFGELANGSVSAMDTPYFFLNYGGLLGLSLVLRALTTRSLSLTLVNLFFGVAYLANHFVSLFRGRPILPWDIRAMNTAADVAAQYNYALTPRILCLCLVILGAATLPYLLKLSVIRDFLEESGKKRKTGVHRGGVLSGSRFSAEAFYTKTEEGTEAKKPLKKRLAARALFFLSGAALLALLHLSPLYGNLQTDSWDVYIVMDYQRQGFPATFLKFYESYQVHAPKGYSQAEVRRIYKEYAALARKENAKTAEEFAGKKHPAKILMIMNESLSEISYENKAIEQDTMPFLRSLHKNTVRGNLYVSVRGGGTCNTEFESLTGNSMAFLPANTYPYEGYLNRDTFSLASYFKNTGYEIASLHLSEKKNWNRQTVYPYLSLEPFFSIRDYPRVPTLRGYATDAFDLETLQKVEEKMSGRKKFLFNVTMQNHGGYAPTNDLTPTFSMKKYEKEAGGDLNPLEVYDTVVRLSDDAIKKLIATYQKDPEPVMIIIYGDHQPALGDAADKLLFGEEQAGEGGKEKLAKYKTPFIIWTNYETPEKRIDALSANYLSYLILKTAGEPLTPYEALIGRCYEEYPVISAYGILDKDGKYVENMADMENKDAILQKNEILLDYAYAQYNNLFDKNRVDKLFTQIPKEEPEK